MATLIILVNEVLDKCELLCARAKPRYKDLFLSLLVNLTDFMSTIDRPEKLDKILKPQRYQIRNFAAVGGTDTATYSYIRQAMYAIPELKMLQAVIILEDFIQKFAGGDVFMLRSSYKAISLPLFRGTSESAAYFGFDYAPGVSEAELDSLFDTLMINHIKESEHACLCLWVADKIVEEAINEFEDFASVIATTPSDLPSVLANLHFLSQDKLDRFRVVIDSKKSKQILDTIKSDPELMLSKMPIIVNKEKVPEKDLESLTKIRSDTIVSSGTIGFPNFLSMAFLVVVGSIDAGLSNDFNKNGVVVVSFDTPEKAFQWVKERPFLAGSKTFRMLLFIDPSSASLTLPKQLKFIRKVRQELAFSTAPILVKIKERSRDAFANFDHTIHELKWIRVTDSEADIVQFGFMTQLDWAKKEIRYPSPTVLSTTAQIPPPEQFSLKITKISCCDVYDGKAKDCSIHFYVNDVKTTHKLKVMKDTSFPVWENLDLQFEVKKGDSFRIEVNADKFGPGIPESQLEIKEIVPDLSSVIISDLAMQTTWPLNANKNDPNTKRQKGRGSITLDFSLELKSSKLPKKPKYFGKTVSESTRQAEEDKVVHIVDQFMYTLLKEVTTEGMFRLPGSTTKIQQLKKMLDEGQSPALEYETVNDICSLMKLYFVELPDSLVPSILYERIKHISLIQDEAERKTQIHAMVSQFPVVNSEMFIDLLSFLHRVSQHSEVNKMTPTNLAVCWTPTIITAEEDRKGTRDAASILNENQTTTELIAWLIENIDSVFPKKEQITEKQFLAMKNEDQTAALCWSVAPPLPEPAVRAASRPGTVLKSSSENTEEERGRGAGKSKSGVRGKSMERSTGKINQNKLKNSNADTVQNVSSSDSAGSDSKTKEPKKSAISRILHNKRTTIKPTHILPIGGEKKQHPLGDDDKSTSTSTSSDWDDDRNLSSGEDSERCEVVESKEAKEEKTQDAHSRPQTEERSKDEASTNETEKNDSPDDVGRKRTESKTIKSDRKKRTETKPKRSKDLGIVSPREALSSPRESLASPRESRSSRYERRDTKSGASLKGEESSVRWAPMGNTELARQALSSLFNSLTEEDKVKFQTFVKTTLGSDLELLKSLSLFLLFSQQNAAESEELKKFMQTLGNM